MAGHHETGGIYEAAVESFDRRGVHGMRNANIVGVTMRPSNRGDNLAFRKRLAALRVRIEEADRDEEEQQV